MSKTIKTKKKELHGKKINETLFGNNCIQLKYGIHLHSDY